jgi:hypothetical protein
MSNVNASHLTVRRLPEDLAAALEREKHRRGTSLNQTVIDLLEQSLGVKRTRRNGLLHLAGTMSEEDHRDLLEGIRQFEDIDPELWK